MGSFHLFPVCWQGENFSSEKKSLPRPLLPLFRLTVPIFFISTYLFRVHTYAFSRARSFFRETLYFTQSVELSWKKKKLVIRSYHSGNLHFIMKRVSRLFDSVKRNFLRCKLAILSFLSRALSSRKGGKFLIDLSENIRFACMNRRGEIRAKSVRSGNMETIWCRRDITKVLCEPACPARELKLTPPPPLPGSFNDWKESF